jgi:hypothetical protein
MEAFTQTQYNPVLKLDFRYLIGAGPRLKVAKKRTRKNLCSSFVYV